MSKKVTVTYQNGDGKVEREYTEKYDLVGVHCPMCGEEQTWRLDAPLLVYSEHVCPGCRAEFSLRVRDVSDQTRARLRALVDEN